MGWFKLPLDVIWKHDMGGRYWTWRSLIGQTFFIWFIVSFMLFFFFPDQAVMPVTHEMTFKDYLPTIATNGFLLLLWIFGVANLLEIRKRRKRGIKYYSYYWGTPRFLPDKSVVHWLVIPLCNGLIAFGVFKLFHALGIYLFILTVIQFAYTSRYYDSKKIDKIDRRDREILLEIKTGEYENDHQPQLEIARIAKPPVRTTANQESAFNERWQKILKQSPAENQFYL
jgi:hypothetical protein